MSVSVLIISIKKPVSNLVFLYTNFWISIWVWTSVRLYVFREDTGTYLYRSQHPQELHLRFCGETNLKPRRRKWRSMNPSNLCTLWSKDFVTVVPLHTVKTYGGSRDIAPLILNPACLHSQKKPLRPTFKFFMTILFAA